MRHERKPSTVRVSSSVLATLPALIWCACAKASLASVMQQGSEYASGSPPALFETAVSHVRRCRITAWVLMTADAVCHAPCGGVGPIRSVRGKSGHPSCAAVVISLSKHSSVSHRAAGEGASLGALQPTIWPALHI